MKTALKLEHLDPEVKAAFMSRLKSLYEAMQRAYGEVAGRYGFTCTGCEDNCCTQRFYHYTLMEYVYLFEGLKKADEETIYKVFTRAKVVTDSYFHELQAGEIFSLMCPVNMNGLCGLYGHRPMICRLHGLPHVFKRPDGEEIRGGGCRRFEAKHGGNDFPAMDRTPFYSGLADIEKDLREAVGFRGKYKKTTAEMIMDMQDAINLLETGEDDLF